MIARSYCDETLPNSRRQTVGGEVAFKVLDGFEVVLRDELILVLANWKGFANWKGGGGGGALRDSIDSNRSFPVMSTLNKVLAAFGIFWHMLDFKSNMSCLAVGRHTCGWASCSTTLATK